MTSPAPLCLRVDAALSGRRADDAILRGFSGFTRSEVKQLFEQGRVRCAGRPLKKGDRVALGMQLEIDAPERPISADPNIELALLFESEDFVIVDKPAGLPTAPLSRASGRSLAAGLLARYPEMQGVGFREREPGLVHRLDTETSGVVLAARNVAAFRAARLALESSGIGKRYLAVVDRDMPAQGEATTWLGPDATDGRRVRVFAEAPASGYAKRASTRYRVVERGPRFALVELDVERAFRHQIRAHLAHLGFPIAGDAVYGGPPAAELGPRHALHASYIAWAGAADRPGFRAEAALPPELRALL